MSERKGPIVLEGKDDLGVAYHPDGTIIVEGQIERNGVQRVTFPVSCSVKRVLVAGVNLDPGDTVSGPPRIELEGRGVDHMIFDLNKRTLKALGVVEVSEDIEQPSSHLIV